MNDTTDNCNGRCWDKSKRSCRICDCLIDCPHRQCFCSYHSIPCIHKTCRCIHETECVEVNESFRLKHSMCGLDYCFVANSQVCCKLVPCKIGLCESAFPKWTLIDGSCENCNLLSKRLVIDSEEDNMMKCLQCRMLHECYTLSCGHSSCVGCASRLMGCGHCRARMW